MKHLADERASLYALSALDEAEAQLFAAHLAEGCDVCEAEVQSFDSVIFALGELSEQIEPSAAVRDRLLSSLKEQPAKTPTRDAGKTVRSILKIRTGEGDWQPFGKGLSRKVLFQDRERGTTTSLIKLEPGARIPSHQHDGIEECVVIEGDIHSDTESFSSGDYLCAPAGSIHEQLFTNHGALLFIVAGSPATI